MGITHKLNKHNERVGLEKYNFRGSLMKIVDYQDFGHITVEFQDDYKLQKRCSWNEWVSGQVKNPYHPSVFEVGIIGQKYPRFINAKPIKEYQTWTGILRRCYDDKYKKQRNTYLNCECDEVWLLY